MGEEQRKEVGQEFAAEKTECLTETGQTAEDALLSDAAEKAIEREPQPVKKRVSRGKKLGILAAVVVVLAVLAVGLGIYNKPENRLARQLDLGARYLEDQNYEQAVIAFNKVIAIDPMSVDAYLGLADAYIGMGDYEEAVEILQRGYELTADEMLKIKWEGITDNNQSMDYANNASNYISTDKEEITDVAQKIKGLAMLFENGRTDALFQFDELTFFGNNIHNMTKETFESILIENGFIFGRNREDDPNYSGEAGWFPEGRSQSAPSISGANYNNDEYYDFWTFRTYTEAEEHMPIGVRDIYTFGTLKDVLSELGFSNGEEISDYINANFATEGNNVDIFYDDGIGSNCLYVLDVYGYSGDISLVINFINLEEDQDTVEYSYSDGEIWKQGDEVDNDINDFDVIELKLIYSQGVISFRFIQTDGMFINFDESSFMILGNN